MIVVEKRVRQVASGRGADLIKDIVFGQHAMMILAEFSTRALCGKFQLDSAAVSSYYKIRLLPHLP